ncbi:hypothetical protein M8C21_013178 [Ambrosia artemisiifolia]|uniref:Uncharacterized protein n=1 Tax=Ambrosia artemisiifolia TaxID=4212 RepID=A0AAD5BRE3_AMBAR|nr:hypothetical protein M8C21_013178 [Ambrosia artemisiifolia]
MTLVLAMESIYGDIFHARSWHPRAMEPKSNSSTHLWLISDDIADLVVSSIIFVAYTSQRPCIIPEKNIEISLETVEPPKHQATRGLGVHVIWMIWVVTLGAVVVRLESGGLAWKRAPCSSNEVC